MEESEEEIEQPLKNCAHCSKPFSTGNVASQVAVTKTITTTECRHPICNRCWAKAEEWAKDKDHSFLGLMRNFCSLYSSFCLHDQGLPLSKMIPTRTCTIYLFSNSLPKLMPASFPAPFLSHEELPRVVIVDFDFLVRFVRSKLPETVDQAFLKKYGLKVTGAGLASQMYILEKRERDVRHALFNRL